MKIKIFFLLLFFSFIINCKLANATDVVDQQQQYRANSILWANGFRLFGQSFIPTKNNISKINIYNNTAMASSTVVLCGGVPEPLSKLDVETNGLSCNWPNNYLIASEQITPSTGGGNNYFTFNTPKPLTIGENYYFIIQPNSYILNLADEDYGLYGNDGLILDGGYKFINNSLAYQEFYSDTYVYIDWQIFWDINVIVPSQDWIYNKMPNNIIFKYTNLGGLYNEAWFQIFRLTTKNGTPYQSMISPNTSIASTTAPLIEGAPINYPDGFYRLYNIHFNGGDNLLLSPIDFQISATSTSIFQNASTTLTEILAQIEETICDDLDTSQLIGQILCAFKRAGLFMFKPSESSITALVGSFIEFKQTFPFNAFFGITDALQNGISTTTASTTIQNFKIPFISATGTITNLTVMSTTTLPNLIGYSNNNIFRQSLIYFAWLLSGIIIYLTIRKI